MSTCTQTLIETPISSHRDPKLNFQVYWSLLLDLPLRSVCLLMYQFHTVSPAGALQRALVLGGASFLLQTTCSFFFWVSWLFFPDHFPTWTLGATCLTPKFVSPTCNCAECSDCSEEGLRVGVFTMSNLSQNAGMPFHLNRPTFQKFRDFFK